MSGDMGGLGDLDQSVTVEQDEEDVHAEQKSGSGVAQVSEEAIHTGQGAAATMGDGLHSGIDETSKHAKGKKCQASRHRRRELQIRKKRKLEWAP